MQLGLFDLDGARRPRELAAATRGDGLDVQMIARPRRQSGAGSQITGGIIDDDDHNLDVHGEKWYGEPGTIGIARKMERDPHVAQSLAIKRAPLQAALWDLDPASKSDLDIEAADYARYVLFECNNFDHVVDIGTLDMRDGFSLVETTDDVKPIPRERFPLHPGGGFGIVTTGFYHIPAWTLKRWHQRKDNPELLKGITQWVIGSDSEKGREQWIPAKRFLRWTRNQDGANFAGFSYLRRSYGAWKIKQTLLILQAIRHERYGVNIPIIKLPEGASKEDFDNAELILSEMRSHEKGYLALPFGYEFDWRGGASGPTNIIETIEQCNRDMAFNMGGGFMLLGLSGKTGSYALAQSQQGQYEIQLEGDAKFFASGFNHGYDGWCYLERLTRINYGRNAGVPRLIARNMPTRDWTRVLPVIHNITTSDHITPDDKLEDFIRRILYMPARDPTTARQRGNGVPVMQEQNPPTPTTESEDD